MMDSCSIISSSFYPHNKHLGINKLYTKAPPMRPWYKWYILALSALTHMLVVAIPAMSLPVLFDEIAGDLSLDIVQIGVIWGLGSLTGIAMSLLGGIIGDCIGAKRTLILACVLTGGAGALRGFATSYPMLAVMVVIAGFFPFMIPTNVHKTCGVWFTGKHLGLANAVVSAGMASGFMLGSLLGASVFSPLLGGWRNVLFVYGGVALLVALIWSTTADGPEGRTRPAVKPVHRPLRESLGHVAGVRNVWLLGLAMLGVGSCIQGGLGYLPLYLRGLGWEAVTADSALATFHGASLLFTIPIALLSDRLGSRRRVLIVATVMIATGFGLLSVADGVLVWGAVILAGVVRDGFMAILMTFIIEIKEIGTTYAGTAVGMIMSISQIGSVLSPPAGNSLSVYSPGLPYLFWAGLALLGLVGFALVREGDKGRG
ncbi:MAG: MFS transporter [Caldilineaceae bacterium]|nr:MFS transporter [Caldilineaceae bacterium]